MNVNTTPITAVGRLVTEVRSHVIPTGVRVANFRIACQESFYDKEKGEWRDGDRIYMGVACWRTTAENAAQSLREGDLVVVRGKLKIREYRDREGHSRTSIEVDARSVGVDLSLHPVTIDRTTWRTSPHQQSLLDPPPTDATDESVAA